MGTTTGKRVGAARRGSRAATLVEYALAVSLVAIGANAGLAVVENEAEEDLDNQAVCLSTRPPPPSCQQAPLQPATGGGSGGSGDDGGGGEGAQPIATVQTESPTTTSSPPLFDVAVATTILDEFGVAIEGEVVSAQITVTASTFPGRVGSFFFVDCTTDEAGACSLSFDSRWADVTELRFEIVNVGVDTTYDFGGYTPLLVGDPG